jgi:hypothetical protein
MANNAELSEIRLMAEIHIPDTVNANRIDVYDWIVGLISDWAMADPQARVTTSPTFHQDGEHKHNRELVIDIIEASGDVGKVADNARIR